MAKKSTSKKAQNGIEGTMGGLTDVGFNYSGSWGGQWAMGGSLPGATGMMYARTVNPAPSNGPYAKKTKASAENGREMAYYQAGLDFKPKTISRDGVSVNMADEQPLKKLDQLLNFTNYNDMAKAKQGKKVKAQYGIGDYMKSLPNQGTMASYNKRTGMVNSPNATVSKADTDALGMTDSRSFGDVAGAAGLNALAGLPQIIGGVEQIIEQGKQRKQQQQLSQITGLAMQAGSRKQVPTRQYVRPEDVIVTADQMGMKSYGVGTSFLEDGGEVVKNRIGGNPTEIQNMYNPGNLYMDLGYEPLNDSNVKQYQDGGGVKFGDFFQSSGQAQIGSTVGAAIGNAILPGIGGAVGQLVGTVGGNLLGGAKYAADMRNIQKQNALNQQQAAYASVMQDQFGAYMEDGGKVDSDYKWMSHTWQPQVITQFGEHKVSDLLKAPKDADMLRSGGHIRENYYFDTDAFPKSQNGSSTMGGELQVIDGGKAETMSYNPFLPDGGETIMFRGRSHDNGGIPINYGENGVEVEGGEPAVKLEDGGKDKSLVVFGNMKINKQAANLMEDPKAKGQKFKNYVADIAKNEAKQNKIIDKSIELVNSSDTNNPFDQLTMNSGMANIMGANMKQRANAIKKLNAAAVQSAILDTAEQLGKDSNDLNEQVTASEKAAFGGKFSKAENGDDIISRMWKKRMPELFPTPVQTPYAPDYAKTLPDVVVSAKKKAPSTTVQDKDIQGVINYPKEASSSNKFPWEDVAYGLTSTALQFLRPSNVQPLDPTQIAPEMMALSTNVLEPVQAQKFTPMLEQVADISLQDQINAIDAQSRAAIRASGYNPAAQAQIAATASRAKSEVYGRQTQMNQQNRAQVANRNIERMNQANLQNLQILDQQYVRQAQAKSATKAQALEAAKSIAAKTLQNKLENQRLAVLQNMYNYRFTPRGVAYNINAPYQFNIPTVIGGTENLTAEQVKARTSAARNGSIVKAIKNL